MPNIFTEDAEQVIYDINIPWNEMKDSTVFVTGATGLIGSALVHTLSAANDKLGLDLHIIAHGRNAIKGEKLSQSGGVKFISGDICKPFTIIADKLDYIFHCAAVTSSEDMVAKPVKVITTAIDGTRNVLELAREKDCKSVVYLSSMEVYGQASVKEVAERDLGYLDLSRPRSSYPESKRMCECLCNCYFSQYGIPVKIARLAQTFGAGSPKDDPRVFSQFAGSAVACENIVLHTKGKSSGNYCYISDAVSGLLMLLLGGKSGEAYNIANPNASMTILEMAELVAKEVCDGRISVVVDIPDDIAKRGYSPDVGFRLNVGKIMKLGWKPQYNLTEMYKRMIAGWGVNV